MKIETISVMGHEIAYREFNPEATNPPLVCIHGITSSVNFWPYGQFDWVKKEVRWITLGLPGHYPSRFPGRFHKDDLTAELVATLLWGVLDQLIGDNPVVIGGHSTGGFAAVAMAAQQPQRVRALYSISGFAHGRWTGALGILQSLAKRPSTRWLFKAQFRMLSFHYALSHFAARLYANDVKALYAAKSLRPTLEATYPHYQSLDLDAMIGWFARMPLVDITNQLHEISAPTLVIHGRQDPIVPFSEGKKIAAGVQNGELIALDGAGHVPMAERQALYESTLDRFWRKWLH